MKLPRALLAGLLAILSTLPARAAPSAVPLDSQHLLLTGLSGPWSVRQSFWAAPGAAPKVDQGKAEFAMVLRQQHLRQKLHIADGTDFEGLGYIGYDTASARFFTIWMDVNFPGMVVAHGGYDAAAKAYIFRGTMAAAGGGAIPVREVMRLTDRDHFTYEYFETHDGREALTVRLEYTRVV
ncbi:DUF1579 family protein [Sphingomonas crusticola]|uniref:DUF1579 family protein n=1 Tax=Sphingomonas crusticola TaxID=1697973 RepID=UPI000E244F24|nr:DUF1579 family protein [Sphingomonas crusticola]